MKRMGFILYCALTMGLPASAQFTFSISLDLSGCWDKSIEAALYRSAAESYFNDYMKQAGIGFQSLPECNTARNIVNNMSNELSSGSCRIRFIVGPCQGNAIENVLQIGAPGSVGTPNVQGVSVGTSFYSTNPVNEVNDWEQDTELRDLVLNQKHQHLAAAPAHQPSGDSEFDRARNEYEFTGNMPAGNNFFSMRNRKDVQSIDDWTASDDLKPINIELRPVESTSFPDTEKDGVVMRTLNSIDSRLDYYGEFGDGNGNAFQYMYTHWGRENVMAGVDLWNNMNIGERLQGAWYSLKNNGLNNLTDGLSGAVKNLLPNNVVTSAKRAKEIFNAEQGIIPNVVQLVKDAPDMIERGQTIDIPHTVHQLSEPINELAINSGVPQLKSAYKQLRQVEDIYYLPSKEQQRTSIETMIRKDADSVLKKSRTFAVKQTDTYKKWDAYKNKVKEKAKRLVDPYHVLFP